MIMMILYIACLAQVYSLGTGLEANQKSLNNNREKDDLENNFK
jgi:hypothetical protein